MDCLKTATYQKFSTPKHYVPIGRYLAVVCLDQSIRQISVLEGVAPSTVSRQLRKIEDRRDDLIMNGILTEFEEMFERFSSQNKPKKASEIVKMIKDKQSDKVSDAKLQVEARRILRRLSEKDAFLLISPDLPNAAVFREMGDGELQRLAVTSRLVAEEFVLRDWVEGRAGQKLGRYQISSRGSSVLKRILQRERALKDEDNQQPSEFAAQHADYASKLINDGGKQRRFQVNVTESPLAILARKKNKNGEGYLTARQVAAGERLREDFEVSQIGPKVTQNWDRFLVAASRGQFHEMNYESTGSEAARTRLQGALAHLGDGLSDIAFRCCCYLEGLETIERKLGWSARSGKVVLKIALERLAEYYQIPERRRGSYE